MDNKRYPKGKALTAHIRALLADIAASRGLTVWDIEYVRENGEMTLRVTIDKAGGVSLEECEGMHRASMAVIDADDPIEEGYTLEFTSPGLNRELRLPEHFEAYIGSPVLVGLYKQAHGIAAKKFTGKLIAQHDGALTVLPDEGYLPGGPAEIKLEKSEYTRVILIDAPEYL